MTAQPPKFQPHTTKELLEDPLLRADFASESFGGGSNIACALGNGRLTVGISPWAEVVYFRWPTLSFYDHLNYSTISHGVWGQLKPQDVRWGDKAPSADWRRYGRPFEVDADRAAKGWLIFADKTTSWLGDPSWTSAREYIPSNTQVLHTHLDRSNSGTETMADITQWVDFEKDCLIQEFQIAGESAQFFEYKGDFLPSVKKNSYIGTPKLDSSGVFRYYFSSSQIMLVFRPKKQNSALTGLVAKNDCSPEQIDGQCASEGFFIAMGFATETQNIGQQSLKCEIQIGEPIRVFISIAKSAQEATELIINARQEDFIALKQTTIDAWQEIANKINLPVDVSEIARTVGERSVLNLFLGRDKTSHAIVAAPTRQPAYHFDWPRDGAFFDLALDLAGFPEIVTQHLDFYRRVQRKEHLDFGALWLIGGKFPFYNPRGHWVSNYYTDGSPGALKIIPLEIDETALLLWDLWRHDQFLQPNEHEKYAEDFSEMLQLAADGVLQYVDQSKGWMKRVNEDDNQVPTATLHGTSAVLTGLSAAVDLGKQWHVDAAKVNRWQAGAKALREGMLKRIKDPKTLQSSGWRGIQWSLFPAPLFENPAEQPEFDALINRLTQDLTAKATGQRGGFAYLGEQIFILGISEALRNQHPPILDEALKILTENVPMPGTNCFGEVTLWISQPNSPEAVAQQRTSIPHLWTGITSYLAVEALNRPERFLNLRPPIP